MRFSEIERAEIERDVGGYCRRKTNPSLSDKLSIEYRMRGMTVTIFENRPVWRGAPGERMHSDVAKLKKNPETRLWQLYWRDRNLRWHLYEDAPPTRRLTDLFAEVDRHPIFWG